MDFSIMTLWEYLILGALIVCAIAVNVTKNLLPTILIYMAFSVLLSIVFLILQAPDLAITELAVGAGIDTILFLLTLKGINQIKGTRRQ